MRQLLTIAVCLLCMAVNGQTRKQKKSHMRDSVALSDVTVTGKSKTQKLREGALSVNAIDVRSQVGSIHSLSGLIDRTTGVKIREDGGIGSDFELSVNGMSGSSVRYFIDGVPLDTKGSGVTIANMPVSMVDYVEVYKGVMPSWLCSDVLGGAVNIVTHRRKSDYLEASYGVGSFHTHQGEVCGQHVFSNGLTLRPSVAVNYSKNDYLMKDVEVWDEEAGLYLPRERRRFHDDYFSLLGQLEVGVSDKPWADNCFVTLTYNKVDKELQTNQVQNYVIGMADNRSSAWSVALRYQKRDFLMKKLNASLSLSHTWDHSVATDTAHRKYDWNGDYIKSSRNEMTGRAFMQRHYKRPLTLAKADLAYRFSDEHLINLSYSFNRTGNDRWDEVDASFEPANDLFAKHVFGLAYNQALLQGRLYNTFFVKDYVNHLQIEQSDLYFITGSKTMTGSNTQNSFGGGLGTKFELMPLLAVKANYEHSVRLPLARELLGNGTTIFANTTLKPEESNNLNAGVFGTFASGRHSLYYELNGFLRYVENYIQPQISDDEGYLQYVNQPAVSIKGLEGELRYDWDKRLQAVANISWQDARDDKRYKDDGKPSITYNNHVPNRPWLFASADVHYRFGNVVAGLDYQWVHWFYLSWEAYGLPETKARIPEKNLLGANVTYSWQDNRYSVSVDCQNLLDQTVYDNYKLQKPGRALFVKFRVLLQ